MPEFVTPTFVKIRTGLLDARHVAAMGGGSPLVLYLYLQSRVHFRGNGAGVTIEPYTHEEAATALGQNLSSIRRWFRALRAGGYITTKQLRYGLEVTITKYDSDSPKEPHQEPSRESTSAHPSIYKGVHQSIPSEIQGVHLCTPGSPFDAPRESISEHPAYKDARTTRDSRDSEIPPLVFPPSAPTEPQPVPKPNRNGAVIDAIRAEDVPVEMTARDHKAVKESQLSPSQIAAAYCALYRGEWGDEYLQTNLSVRLVIERWAGYQATLTQPAPQRRQQRVYAGTAAVAEAIRRRNANGTDFDPSRRGMGGSATLPRLSG